jgi:hypothetical protein
LIVKGIKHALSEGSVRALAEICLSPDLSMGGSSDDIFGISDPAKLLLTLPKSGFAMELAEFAGL